MLGEHQTLLFHLYQIPKLFTSISLAGTSNSVTVSLKECLYYGLARP